MERAAGIALAAIRDFLADDDRLETVTMVLWSAADLATYERVLREMGGV